jgi:hypothetical protein
VANIICNIYIYICQISMFDSLNWSQTWMYTNVTPITQTHNISTSHNPNPEIPPQTQQKTASILWENFPARNIDRIVMGLLRMIFSFFWRLMP